MNKGVKISRAIKKINPNAQAQIIAEDVNQITWLDGTAPIPAADIEAQFSIVEQEEQAAIDKRESGKQKLKDLGLDDDEIQALIGA
tara:strand:+ start:1183 stop:1440 length:258 start_codon:yes stop_codon:yes gene_type:complete